MCALFEASSAASSATAFHAEWPFFLLCFLRQSHKVCTFSLSLCDELNERDELIARWYLSSTKLWKLLAELWAFTVEAASGRSVGLITLQLLSSFPLWTLYFEYYSQCNIGMPMSDRLCELCCLCSRCCCCPRFLSLSFFRVEDPVPLHPPSVRQKACREKERESSSSARVAYPHLRTLMKPACFFFFPSSPFGHYSSEMDTESERLSGCISHTHWLTTLNLTGEADAPLSLSLFQYSHRKHIHRLINHWRWW